jgi:hypothetical protein
MEEVTDILPSQAESEVETDSPQELDPIAQATTHFENILKTGNFRLAGDEIEELSKGLEGEDLDSVIQLGQRLKLDPVALIIGGVCLVVLLVVAALYVFH